MFGSMLREWRQVRRYSQARLAESAEVSTRHLSCLERGVARPSRQMVLVLASALDMPLRQRNALLRSAGFASAYRETDLEDAELAPVRQALAFLLERAEPNAAVVVDRLWNVRMMNRPFEAFLRWFTQDPSSEPLNLARTTVDPRGLGRFVVNRDQVAADLIERIRREAQVARDDDLTQLADELSAMSGHTPDAVGAPTELLIPVILEKDGLQARLFTTLTSLSTPMDVTLQELRIETYFPADEATAQLSAALMEAVTQGDTG